MDNKVSSTKKNMGGLIVFEGISGCGKSENVRKLANYLDIYGYENIVVEWNSHKKIRRITAFLQRKNLLPPSVYSILQWISFIYDYVTVISPSYSKGYIVVADRYVYTGVTRDIVNGASSAFGKFLMKRVRKPDLVFFCDIHPNICYERITYRGKKLFHTNKTIKRSKLLKNKTLYYLKKIRYQYLSLFESFYSSTGSNVIVVNDDYSNVEDNLEKFLRLKDNEEFMTKKNTIAFYEEAAPHKEK